MLEPLRRPVTPQILAVTTLGYFRHGVYVDPAFESPTGTRGREVGCDCSRRLGPGGRCRLSIRRAVQSGAELGRGLLASVQDDGSPVEGRMWHMRPFSKFEQTEDYTMTPQVGASLLYEF